ncbi:hypothetical protein [Spongiactinospora gelatinilytica]|uniref:TetR/AcrR family transcriptional regulator n=1 Tax=Spongiactinospora gelatinilytica TaxID=2666298 RepID=UPI0011B9462A|nr:hypothetical protein [Spongiactinospora gelatinilytica]
MSSARIGRTASSTGRALSRIRSIAAMVSASYSPGKGPASDLPDLLLRSVVSQEWHQTGGEHPFVAMLRSSAHEPAHRRMQEQICGGFMKSLKELVEGPDPALRAELLGALVLGISVARSVVRSPVLADASYDQIEPYYRRLAEALLGPGDRERSAQTGSAQTGEEGTDVADQ